MISIETEYRGARLKLDVSNPPRADLYINGIRRATETSDASRGTVRLGSTVQTDYEWHEYIEAVVTFSDGACRILLSANNQTLLEETHQR